MYYTVYKTTNQTNGKVYIGTHKTKNLNDNYMGSGTYLKRAIEKYGLDIFNKEILHVFDNPEDMYAKEAELVDADFLMETNTYNLTLGGKGSFDHINSDVEFRIRKNRRAMKIARSNGIEDSLRDYHKRRLAERKETYYDNPKECLRCFETIPYEKKRNKYCGSSCAAKITNVTHPKRKKLS